MPKIENLTNRPVLLRCNSGETLHIAPRAISADVLDVEVKDNPKVQKLLEQHLIALREAGESKQTAAPAGAGKETSEATKEGKDTESTKRKK